MIKITSVKTRQPSTLQPRVKTMTRNNKSRSNHNGKGQDKQVKNASQPSDSQVKTRMIMRMTALIPRQDKIKETFKDKEGNDIKEYVQRR